MTSLMLTFPCYYNDDINELLHFSHKVPLTVHADNVKLSYAMHARDEALPVFPFLTEHSPLPADVLLSRFVSLILHSLAVLFLLSPFSSRAFLSCRSSGLIISSPFQSWESVANPAAPGGNLPVVERMPFAPARESQLRGAAAITPSESTAFDLVNDHRRQSRIQKKAVGIRGKEVYEIVRNFTHPSEGHFPCGVAPKTIYAEILRSSVLPNWTRNQLQVELYRGVKLGRYIRVAPALYSTTENWEKRECAKLKSMNDGTQDQSATTASSKSLVTCEGRRLIEHESKPKNSCRGAAAQPSEAATIRTPFIQERLTWHPNEKSRYSKRMGGKDSTNNFVSSMECHLLPEDGFELPSLKEDPAIMEAARTNVRQWTAAQVRQFVEKLGFAREAKAFEKESIDGESLFLLTRTHFISRLGIQLGPALCIFRRILTLKAVIDKTGD
ncbi:hypothetical protein M514_04311 [Trichuris suis]|uniref:SAM domain-containing protein n=1 Tax=Trichuris suis TaxID=68888 RepID=A0A085NQK6_9BILA|nr:hypothetical protein M514_04311 [Trichuris suis]